MLHFPFNVPFTYKYKRYGSVSRARLGNEFGIRNNSNHHTKSFRRDNYHGQCFTMPTGPLCEFYLAAWPVRIDNDGGRR